MDILLCTHTTWVAWAQLPQFLLMAPGIAVQRVVLAAGILLPKTRTSCTSFEI